jgi:hypothetical protein
MTAAAQDAFARNNASFKTNTNSPAGTSSTSSSTSSA